MKVPLQDATSSEVKNAMRVYSGVRAAELNGTDSQIQRSAGLLFVSSLHLKVYPRALLPNDYEINEVGGGRLLPLIPKSSPRTTTP